MADTTTTTVGEHTCEFLEQNAFYNYYSQLSCAKTNICNKAGCLKDSATIFPHEFKDGKCINCLIHQACEHTFGTRPTLRLITQLTQEKANHPLYCSFDSICVNCGLTDPKVHHPQKHDFQKPHEDVDVWRCKHCALPCQHLLTSSKVVLTDYATCITQSVCGQCSFTREEKHLHYYQRKWNPQLSIDSDEMIKYSKFPSTKNEEYCGEEYVCDYCGCIKTSTSDKHQYNKINKEYERCSFCGLKKKLSQQEATKFFELPECAVHSFVEEKCGRCGFICRHDGRQDQLLNEGFSYWLNKHNPTHCLQRFRCRVCLFVLNKQDGMHQWGTGDVCRGCGNTQYKVFV